LSLLIIELIRILFILIPFVLLVIKKGTRADLPFGPEKSSSSSNQLAAENPVGAKP